MRNLSKFIGALALLALPLALSLPAYAQVTETTTTTTSVPVETTVEQHVVRQDYREEMQRIRLEHEQLESEHDTLKATCMNTKGQDHLDCQRKWSDLRARKEALHQRMQVLHQKTGYTDDGSWKTQHVIVREAPAGAVSVQPGGTAPAAVTTTTIVTPAQ